MAVLGRLTLARLLLGLAAAALAGCVVLSGLVAPVRSFAFSHHRHVTLEKLECANCHADALHADDPGMPSPDTCEVCHAETDIEKPPEKRAATLFDGESFRALHASALASEVVFSHRRHAAGSVACADCHAGIETNERVERLRTVTMDACTACHDGRRVDATARGCALCHTEITEQWAPGSHAASWKKMHGAVARGARAHAEATADKCILCHTESTCSACHQVEAPESHTQFWHLRGHGVAAMVDRESCAACHEPMSCERCHAEAVPSNHTGAWGSPMSTHCLVCHQPLNAEGCVACHATATSHLAAPPMPPDHRPGLNCRQCHGASLPLQHVDNGDDCTSCHL